MSPHHETVSNNQTHSCGRQQMRPIMSHGQSVPRVVPSHLSATHAHMSAPLRAPGFGSSHRHVSRP